MNARARAGCCLLILALAATGAQAQVFSPIPPDVWPKTVPTPVTVDDIWHLFRDKNYAALLRLAKDEAIKASLDQVIGYMKSPVKMKKLAAQLNAIIDDPAKTPEQKKDALIQLTDNSFDGTPSAPVGVLNVTMKHSIELGVTRLEWDDKVRNGHQSGGHLTGSCSGSTTSMSCSWGGSFSKCYYRSQPDYHIYRIVNGQETEITMLKGYMYSSGSSGFQVNANLWTSIWNGAKYYYTNVLHGTYPDAVPGRAFFYDFQADMRPPGSTLSYRVVTFDDWLFGVIDTDGDGYGDSVACGAATGGMNTTTVVADGNGDGRVDFLTAADFSKYWKKYMGWLPSVIDSILQ